MENYAGRSDKDKEIGYELKIADIKIHELPEFCRDKNGEVKTIIIGTLSGWSFKRYWYYWVCNGPGIPPMYAERLNKTHGDVVRIDGCGYSDAQFAEHCKGFAVGSYHVDTQEGLIALANTIRQVRFDAGFPLDKPE